MAAAAQEALCGTHVRERGGWRFSILPPSVTHPIYYKLIDCLWRGGGTVTCWNSLSFRPIAFRRSQCGLGSCTSRLWPVPDSPSSPRLPLHQRKPWRILYGQRDCQSLRPYITGAGGTSGQVLRMRVLWGPALPFSASWMLCSCPFWSDTPFPICHAAKPRSSSFLSKSCSMGL